MTDKRTERRSGFPRTNNWHPDRRSSAPSPETDAMRPVPKDAPVLIAWENYKASAEYANTRKWALHEAHVDGSLWASFYAGFFAAAVDSVELENRLRLAVEALEELVACKDLKEQVERMMADLDYNAELVAVEYERRKDPAWTAARAALTKIRGQ